MPHVRKSKLIEQRLQLHAHYLVANPADLRGSWRSLMPNAKVLRVDLGCGKGLWTTRAAAMRPDELFIGIDCERMCVSFAVEQAACSGMRNAFFVQDSALHLEELFAEGEINALHLNFPTPFPRKKEARHRVTDGARLMAYRALLADGGAISLKTDSQPLYDFTLEQLVATGYDVTWQTRDLHGEARPAVDACAFVASGYEEKLTQRGAKVHALRAEAGVPPEKWEPGEKVGLVDYLPDNLDELDYAPLGMEDTVANLRNRKRNATNRSGCGEK